MTLQYATPPQKEPASGFWEPTNPSADTKPMSSGRLLLAYGVIAAIVGGSLLDLVRDTEGHWPWSNYPMYSYIRVGPQYADYRLYGVPADNPNTEISLFTDERYLQPFDQSRLEQLLDELHDNKPKLESGMKNCLDRYEALRKGGRHDGPELIKLRTYQCFWTIDPSCSTIEKPDRKVLIDEITMTKEKKS